MKVGEGHEPSREKERRGIQKGGKEKKARERVEGRGERTFKI